MTRVNQQVPDEATETPDRETARDKRRGDALRANLKRRKAQMRGRAQPDAAAGDPADDAR